MIVDRIEKHFRILGRLKRKLDLTRRNREAGSLTRFDGSNLRYSSSELQIHDLEAWTSFAEETICQATWIYDWKFSDLPENASGYRYQPYSSDPLDKFRCRANRCEKFEWFWKEKVLTENSNFRTRNETRHAGRPLSLHKKPLSLLRIDIYSFESRNIIKIEFATWILRLQPMENLSRKEDTGDPPFAFPSGTVKLTVLLDRLAAVGAWIADLPNRAIQAKLTFLY